MRLAAWVGLLCVALGGCGTQPIWRTQDVQERSATDAASAPGAGAESPMARETGPREPVEAARKGELAVEPKRAPLLVAGIAAYENGKYVEAAKALRAALATRLDKSDQLAVHKYLAFIECSTGRRNQCREEFRKALRIDPSFELEPAEAGHPVWGPIFRGLKPKPKR
jgi:tetratricopeptide (TPR) repeat protein